VGQTDGVDALNIRLNDQFPQGIFTFHNEQDCCPTQAVRWEEIAAQLGGLMVDTESWRRSATCP